MMTVPIPSPVAVPTVFFGFGIFGKHGRVLGLVAVLNGRFLSPLEARVFSGD